jgi:hypothetical protein
MPSVRRGYLALSFVGATLLFRFPFYYVIGVIICFVTVSITEYRRQHLSSVVHYQQFGVQELAWLLLFSSSPLLMLHLFLKLAARLINILSKCLGVDDRPIATFVGLELIGVALLLERKLSLYTVSSLPTPADFKIIKGLFQSSDSRDIEGSVEVVVDDLELPFFEEFSTSVSPTKARKQFNLSDPGNFELRRSPRLRYISRLS